MAEVASARHELSSKAVERASSAHERVSKAVELSSQGTVNSTVPLWV